MKQGTVLSSAHQEKTWGQQAWRVLLELLLLLCAGGVGLVLFTLHVPPSVLRSLLLFLVGPVSLVYYGLRLPLAKQGPGWQVGVEFGSGLALSLLLGILGWSLSLLPGGGLAPGAHWRFSEQQAAGIVTCSAAIGYAFVRLGKRVWTYWEQLQRRRLLWAFTHVHLSIFLLLAAVVSVGIVWLLWLTIGDLSLVILAVLGLALLSLAVLLVAVPFAVAFTYLLLRRMIPRLKALAQATGELRDGNYSIRIQVQGEDEVAQVQSDFNVMAETLEKAMSELQQTMSALQRERDTVTRLLQERRQLMANVSHELRTPLSTLRSYLEITLTRWDETNLSGVQRNLQVMEEEVLHLQTQVEDLFALSRAEVGRMTLQRKPVDIASLVQRIVEARAPMARQVSHLELLVDISTPFPPIMGDVTRLEQVLHNLLHNAMRHTPPGGMVGVMGCVEEGWVVLQVRDTGEGIPSEDLPHIWERFYQVEKTQHRGGTGLGLSLCKEWIEGMRGTITVDSKVGEGTCVTLRLPKE